jgi:predicted transcriptional regulator
MPHQVPKAPDRVGSDPPDRDMAPRWAEALLSFVQRYPGVYLRELVRRLEIPMGTLHYHLQRQVASGLVESREVGGHLCLYPCRPPVGRAPPTESEKNSLAMLRLRIPRMIMLRLMDGGPCAGARLVDDLSVSPSHLSYYLERLEKLGIVCRDAETAGHRRVRLVSPDSVRGLLLAYPPLREGPGDKWLDLWEGLRL